jgi:hypothetical protein
MRFHKCDSNWVKKFRREFNSSCVHALKNHPFYRICFLLGLVVILTVASLLSADFISFTIRCICCDIGCHMSPSRKSRLREHWNIWNVPMTMPSEISKIRIGTIIALFVSFKSLGGKSAITVELRNSAVN